jgi:hypothetical protein
LHLFICYHPIFFTFISFSLFQPTSTRSIRHGLVINLPISIVISSWPRWKLSQTIRPLLLDQVTKKWLDTMQC